MLSNWRNRPRPIEKSVEQGSLYNRRNREAGEGETVTARPVVAVKRGNARGAKISELVSQEFFAAVSTGKG
jgi:hypothetical protein